MPDWKFFLTNGKKNRTGIMDITMAARDIVMGETLCIMVSGSPSVIDEVEMAFNKKYCKVSRFLSLV